MDLDKVNGNNTIILDSLNLAFRYKYNKTKSFAERYLETVKSFAKSYNADKVFILCDGGSYYRKEIYPDYKANRTKLIEEQTEQEKEEWDAFIKEYDRSLILMKEYYPVFRFKGVEADDIAAYIVRGYSKKLNNIWLISSDRDWDLLLSDTVSRFSFVTRKEITANTWNDFYPYDMENHIDIKVLQGDKGDNIPGVASVGEKRAYALLKEYGSAYDIYDALPLEGTQKFIQNLNNFGDKLLLNYQLMDLVSYCGGFIK